MEKVRIGIIGFGHMGSQHSNALLANKVDNAVLTAIADIDPKKLEKAKALAGDKVKYFNSAEELMDSGEVDAVIPTCPHYYHPVYGIYAHFLLFAETASQEPPLLVSNATTPILIFIKNFIILTLF